MTRLMTLGLTPNSVSLPKAKEMTRLMTLGLTPNSVSLPKAKEMTRLMTLGLTPNSVSLPKAKEMTRLMTLGLTPNSVSCASSLPLISNISTISFSSSSYFQLASSFSFSTKITASGKRNFVLRGCKSETKLREFMESEKEFPEFNRNLYPSIEPYSSGFLKVSDIHTIYWEQSGNPNGHPVVFLHGGPGVGTSPNNRRFFDSEFYRIILLDQRGSGKSTPHACLEENTTWDLISDIEKLREHLEIPEWQVFGGSWGSTLALAYSQSHPEKVTGMVLRGIFLLRKKEIDWLYEGGAAAIYPDAWEQFRDLIPESERGSFVEAYRKRLNSDDKEIQHAAARAWTMWEMMTAHFLPNNENIKRGEDDSFSLAFARIENHYFVNRGFFPSDGFLLDNIDKIRHIRTTIVQGRYDVCCPMMSAWDLHKAWPEADLKVIQDAGHSANEPGIAAELVAANEKLKHIKNGA